jgi:hypothetical protein
MNRDRLIELMKIELECVSRENCDRNCSNCELVQQREELIDAYKSVINVLEKYEGELYGKCDS